MTIYALALSHLAGIHLFDIKCAWFNEEEYCEFFPRKILARRGQSLKRRDYTEANDFEKSPKSLKTLAGAGGIEPPNGGIKIR